MIDQDVDNPSSQSSHKLVTILSELEARLRDRSIEQPHEWIVRVHPSLTEFVKVPEVRERLEEMGIKVVFEEAQ